MILTAPNILIPRQHIWTPRRKGKLAALVAMANIFRWQGLDRSAHSCATCGCTAPCTGPTCAGCGSSCGPHKTQVVIAGVAPGSSCFFTPSCTVWNATWLLQSLSLCTMSTSGPVYCGGSPGDTEVQLTVASDRTLTVVIGFRSGTQICTFRTVLASGTDCNAFSNFNVPYLSSTIGAVACDYTSATCHLTSVP